MAGPEISTLVEIAQEAGALVLSMQPDAKSEVDKGRGDLATDADLAAERLIISRLSSAYPHIPTVAEESASGSAVPAECFVVDPIDGTIPFSRNSKNFGVTLCYVRDQRPQLGAIVLPALDQVIASERGKGCFLNGSTISFAERAVPHRFSLGFDIYFATNTEQLRGLVEPFVDRFQMLFSFGAAVRSALGLFIGEIDVYLNPGSKVWDFAALVLAVEEAGGYCSSLSGQSLSWDRVEMSGIFSANRLLAEEIAGIIRNTYSL